MLQASHLVAAGRLADVSATMSAGQVTAICGPNGAGKSSLLAAIAGLLPLAAGDVWLDGHALAQLDPAERARRIGYLPQAPEVAWDVAVEVLVGLGRLPWPDGSGDDAVDKAIVAMDLEPLRHRRVSQLSGGERARVLMARVLASEPRWLLADEPLASLDLSHALALMAAIRAQAVGGVGVVLVLHDLAMAMNHADRVLVLHQGRLVADGPPQQALSEGVIADVWGVTARWLGTSGSLALAVR